MKTCATCKKEKDISEFTKNKSRKDGFNHSCKSCKKTHQRNWYNKACGEQKKRVAKRNREVKTSLIKTLFEYLKEHPCVKCGEADTVVLEFDHLRDKTCEVSKLIARAYSWERILEEIAKCQVLCANCHRRKTATDQNWTMHRLQNNL